MATRYVQQASNQSDPVYKGAIQGVSAQIPQVNDLYEALVAGLEGQAMGGTEDILASAEQRGVGRARLGEDVGATLNTALDLERNRAGAQQAGDISAITGNLTDLRTDRVTNRQALGDSFQDIGLAKQENQLILQEQKRQYEQNMLALKRQAELDKKAAAIQRSRASSSGGGGGYGYSSGSGGGGQSGPLAEQREDGGFNFTDSKGNPISAAKYAQQTGQDIRDVLQQMGQNGDEYAKQVYNQLLADPTPSKRLKQYKQLYSPLFWGS